MSTKQGYRILAVKERKGTKCQGFGCNQNAVLCEAKKVGATGLGFYYFCSVACCKGRRVA